ncbi:MAG: diguanylate cyclase [Campylobacterota bacterium]|nr:diguanylate cyclase [Campylobacterota bacterium]
MKNYKFYIVTSILFIVLVLFSKIYIDFIYHKKNELQELSYKKQILDSKKRVADMIFAKQKATVAMALSLSNDKELLKNLENNNISKNYYTNLIENFKQHTEYKNIWIHIIDKDLTSLYRSWTDKSGDSLKDIRKDLHNVLATKKVTYTISPGKFDLSIKAIVPIFENNEIVGILEVISHFNSISKQLKKFNTDSIVVLDKRFKQQLLYPFTNLFIGDYYIANFDASPQIREYLKNNEIQRYFNPSFIIENNYMVISYPLKSLDDETIAYYLMFKKLEYIDSVDLDFFVFRWIALALILVMAIAGVVNITMFYFIRKQRDELELLSVTDGLTGIGNRRFFQEKMKDEIIKVKRYKHSLSFIMLDIDHFKQVNDIHGHGVGDSVLKEYTNLISLILREGDIFARIGGEEFMIIVPYASGVETRKIAEKLRIEVQNHKKILPITMSFGVTEYKFGEEIEVILKRVDKALYEAKESGRNKVVVR